MHLSPQEIRRRFRSAKLRLTPQRAAIYGALVENPTHPSADELLDIVRRNSPDISANTVYYTLAALRTAGLVQEVNYGHDRARFDGNVEPHHHVVCRSCQRIVDVMDGRLDRVNRSMMAGMLPYDFQVTGHRVEFYGYCGACRAGQSDGSDATRRPR